MESSGKFRFIFWSQTTNTRHLYIFSSFIAPISTDVESSQDILCSQIWVQTCERVKVDFRFEVDKYEIILKISSSVKLENKD